MVEADKMAKASWKGSDDRKMESEISTDSKGRLNIRKTCDTMGPIADVMQEDGYYPIIIKIEAALANQSNKEKNVEIQSSKV